MRVHLLQFGILVCILHALLSAPVTTAARIAQTSGLTLNTSLTPIISPAVSVTMSSSSLVLCENPDCGRYFPTIKGMRSHLRQAKSCSWWIAYSKSPAHLASTTLDAPPTMQIEASTTTFSDMGDDAAATAVLQAELDDEEDDRLAGSSGWQEEDDDGDEEIEIPEGEDEGEDVDVDEDDDAGDAFREWLENAQANEVFEAVDDSDAPGLGVAGPGPSTQRIRLNTMLGGRARYLDDDEDDSGSERVSDAHATAGVVIRVAETVHEQWASLFGTKISGDVVMDGSGAPDVGAGDWYKPFASELDWKVAQWMVDEGIGHNAFDKLLRIPGVKEKLGLSYNNTRGLHKVVDSIPRRAGAWKVKNLTFPDRPDEKFVLRHRDILDSIRSLWGDPELAQHLVYKPSTLFSDESRGRRLYNEMWTGKWWNLIQNKLPVGRTVAPLIVSTDKTQLTQFSGSRQAYPVYLTLGNIPSSLRRKPSQLACILVAYLPIDKMSKGKLSKVTMGSRYQRLFHAAMAEIFAPLKEASANGVEMTSGDGTVRRVHPVLACYVADYPEQCLITCSKSGTCPKCRCGKEDMGDKKPSALRTPGWTLGVMKDAKASTTSASAYFQQCMANNVSGHAPDPFWADLPHTNIHLSTTPDVLHQLYQGVLKHMIEWIQTLMTEEELDRRLRCLPPALGLRHFKNGISALSQVSGTERKNMGKILLACIVGTTIPESAVTACRAILDFIYLAQYSTHDEETLGYMDAALDTWHAKKDYFIRVGIRKDFNFPKLHSLRHYVLSIRMFGATNNFNTEMFERLHIDFSKKGWRASNKRDEYPQMTTWVLRKENVHAFHRYTEWVQKQIVPKPQPIPSTIAPPPVPIPPIRSGRLQEVSLTKNPSIANNLISRIAKQHRVPLFPSHLLSYLHALGRTALGAGAQQYPSLPFTGVDVYHSFKFGREGITDDNEVRDAVKASPLDGGRFDTVVVITGDDAESVGLDGTRVGRVHVVFKIPSTIYMHGIYVNTPSHWPRHALAYVEWYTKPILTEKAKRSSLLPSLSKAFLPDKTRAWSIVPLTNIRQSAHLAPDFAKCPPADWDIPISKSSVLDTCSYFTLNNWSSIYTYQTIYLA